MKDKYSSKKISLSCLKRFLLAGVFAVMLSFCMIACVEVKRKPSENTLHCVFNDKAVDKAKGFECLFVMNVSTRSKLSSMGVLKNDLCYGSIGLWRNGGSQLGSDFHITNFEIVDQNTFTFHVVYAGVKGERVDVPGCRFVRRQGNVADLYLGKGWPFSSEYQVAVDNDEIFVVKEKQMDTWYGFSLKKPYASDRYMYQIYSKYQWCFVAVFLLSVILLIGNGAYSQLGMLIVMGGISFVSVTQDWTLAFPVVLPFFVALLLLLIPYIRTLSLSAFIFLAVAGCIHAICMLWHYYSFFMFLWKVMYIGVFTLMSIGFGCLVFSGFCDKCGRFSIKECYRRKEYFAAKDVLSIPVNSRGVMSNDSMSFINKYEEKTDEKCYWCDKD